MNFHPLFWAAHLFFTMSFLLLGRSLCRAVSQVPPNITIDNLVIQLKNLATVEAQKSLNNVSIMFFHCFMGKFAKNYFKKFEPKTDEFAF